MSNPTPQNGSLAVDPHLVALWSRLATIGIGLSLAVLSTVLIGLVGGIEWLVRGPNVLNVRAVQPWTLVLLTAVALAVLIHRWRPVVASSLFLIVGILGLGLLATFALGAGEQVAAGIGFGPGHDLDPYSGIPSSNTAFLIATLGIGGFIHRRTHWRSLGVVLTAAGAAVAGTVLLGYAYGDRNLASFPFSQTEAAVPSSVAAVLIGLSMLIDHESVAPTALSTNGPGGILMRRFVPAALLLPPVLFGFVQAQARFDVHGLLAGVAVAMTAVLIGSFALTARRLDELHEQRKVATDHARRARMAVRQRAPVVGTLGEALRWVTVDQLGNLRVADAFKPFDGYAAGDSYGVCALDESRVGVVMVDAAGHGAEPSILSLRIRDSLLAAVACGTDPGSALDSLGWLLADASDMATAVVAIVDTNSGVCRYASAGHPPLILVREDGVEVLESTGPMLACMVEGPWSNESVVLAPESRLVFHTDGVADVFPVEGAPSGYDRLTKHLLTFRGSAAALADSCIEISSSDGEQRDDAAAVVLEWAACSGVGRVTPTTA